MLTNFCPILTTYLPNVDKGWHLNYYLPNVNVDNWNTTPPLNMYLIFLGRLYRKILGLKCWNLCMVYILSKPQKSAELKILKGFLKNVNVDTGRSLYPPTVDIRWHLIKYLPTSSCQRSFWMSPCAALISMMMAKLESVDLPLTFVACNRIDEPRRELWGNGTQASSVEWMTSHRDCTCRDEHLKKKRKRKLIMI